MTLLPATAAAQAILQQRCANDALNPSQSEARIYWARRCALSVGTPSSAYGYWGMMSANGAGELIEYNEDDYSTNFSGKNTYIGQSDVYEINNSTVNKVYNFGPTSQGLDDQGNYEWWRDPARRKERPFHPTFGSESNINSSTNKQLFPHPTLANCTLYLDKNGTQPASGYNFYVNGYCEASAPTSRCDTDRLSVRQARERLDWVRQCALSQNVGSKSAWLDTGIPASNGSTLKDYSEAGAPSSRRYTGDLYGYDINATHTELRYLSGPTTQLVDAQGYYLWKRDASRQKQRPLYPIYGSTSSNSTGVQLFPNLSDCSLYASGSETPASSFYVTAYCSAIY